MKILNFGSCNIDVVYAVDHIVAPGETTAAGEPRFYPGGKGLNQSLALARAGAKVYHAGAVGEDGGDLVKLLSEAGVDTSCLKSVPGKTGHAVIQVDKKGANSILICGGANRKIAPADAEAVLGHFGAGDYLVLQNEISSLKEIIRLAAARGMKIFFNPSPFDEALSDLDWDALHCLLLNETEARLFCGCGEPEGFARRLREDHPSLRAVLTLGGAGCAWIGPEGVITQETFPVKVVDTTAAGDTFTGYFIASLAAGENVRSALRRANAAASVAVSRAGAAPSIPTAAETSAFLSKFETL